MVKAFRFLIAGVASSTFAVMTAAPAQADEANYLHLLLPKYTSLSTSTPALLAEGYKVCQGERSGKNSSDTFVFMVYEDLDVSMTAAWDIVSAAAAELC
jgi:hypothetical protein